MAYGADAMGEEQPAFVEFDGRAAIADLDELPRIFGLHDHLAEAPFVEVVRQDEVQALIVVARDHRIAPADLSRKKRHPLVVRRSALERCQMECHEVPGFDQLRPYAASAVGGEGRIIGGLARSEEHTSELQSLMRISYAVFCLKKKKTHRK